MTQLATIVSQQRWTLRVVFGAALNALGLLLIVGGLLPR